MPPSAPKKPSPDPAEELAEHLINMGPEAPDKITELFCLGNPEVEATVTLSRRDGTAVAVLDSETMRKAVSLAKRRSLPAATAKGSAPSPKAS